MDVRDWAVIGSGFIAAGSLALSYSELSRTSRSEKRCERVQKIAQAAPVETRAHLEQIAERACAEVVARYWFKTQPMFYPGNVLVVVLFVGLGVTQAIRFRIYGGQAQVLVVGLSICATIAGQSLYRLARREYDLMTATLLIYAGVDSPDEVTILSFQERSYEAAYTRDVPKRVQKFQARVNRSLSIRQYFTDEELKRQARHARKRAERHAAKYDGDTTTDDGAATDSKAAPNKDESL